MRIIWCLGLIATAGVYAGQMKSKLVRNQGVEFLMVALPVNEFQSLLAQVRSAGSNQVKLKKPSMIPLGEDQTGTWSSSLIAGENTSVAGGVSKVPADWWRVGLIFPPEILDRYNFSITDRHKNADVDQQLDPRHAFAYFPLNNPAQVAAYNRRFQFKENIPLSELALVWIPYPVLQSPQPDITALAFDSFEKMLPPPNPEALGVLDLERRMGTWAFTVPNWKTVSAQLSTSPPCRSRIAPPPMTDVLSERN